MERGNVYWRFAAALAVALAVFGAQGATSEYPDRPIRYIVPSAAGGGADISARLLTAELSQQLKQQ